MSYKNIIKRIINEAISHSYGHWIGPDGTSVDVSYSHAISAGEVVKDLYKKGKITEEQLMSLVNLSSEHIENFLYERGWLRGVIDGKGEYYVNGKNNQRLTPKQETWLKHHGEDNRTMVAFLPRGEGNTNRGVKFIHNPNDTLQESTIPILDKKHEKMARFFIYSVWRHMKREDRFSPHQFSIYMDNERHLSDMKQRLAHEIYPNDDDASNTFFDKIVIPTLQKLEDAYNNRKAEKIDKNDPLFILKSIIKHKPYPQAKKALYKNNLNSKWFTNRNVTDEEAEGLFQRLYRLAMGETMYEDNFVKANPYLSDLRNPSPTNSKTEELFVQHYAGYKAEKFPDKVVAWRGTNSPNNQIRPGDFVTLDKDYAYAYVTGKYGTVVRAELASKDLKVYKLDIDTSEFVYWPPGHTIKKYTGHIPTFKEFWEQNVGFIK